MNGLFDGLAINPCLPTATFNTGSMWDLMTGNAVQGIDGRWYIMGGISNIITSLQGKGSTYKSTIAGSLLMRAMGIYHQGQTVLVDTENAITRDMYRVYRMAEDFQTEDLATRILVVSGATNDIDSVFSLIKEICLRKEKNRKDFLIELPIIDLVTMKPMVVWMPTFLMVDSLSEMFSTDEDEMLTNAGLDDKKSKTIYMVDGNKKTLLLRTMRRYCEQYGICMICTAHIGNKISMDGMPVSKELQFQPQGDQTKNVGSKFKFLTGVLAQTSGCHILEDSNKCAMYPFDENTPAKDINEITTTIQRCKNNMGGYSFPFVVSQSTGLLNTVSNFHYLRSAGNKENAGYGLSGNNTRQQSVWLPDITVTRNTIRRQASENYPLRRAVEITAQYLYMKRNWAVHNTPFNFNYEPQQLFDELNKNSGMVDRILNSRGHWVYDDKCFAAEREYLGVFDVLTLLQNPLAYPQLKIVKTSAKTKVEVPTKTTKSNKIAA